MEKELNSRDWSKEKIHLMELMYGEHVREFAQYNDDRKLYCNVYHQAIKAIESLNGNDDIYVHCAMNEALADTRDCLNRILDRFGKK